MTQKEEISFRVMRLLQENPNLIQLKLAQKLSISFSGLNYCLKELMAKAALTYKFLQRKMDEYKTLKVEI